MCNKSLARARSHSPCADLRSLPTCGAAAEKRAAKPAARLERWKEKRELRDGIAIAKTVRAPGRHVDVEALGIRRRPDVRAHGGGAAGSKLLRTGSTGSGRVEVARELNALELGAALIAPQYTCTYTVCAPVIRMRNSFDNH